MAQAYCVGHVVNDLELKRSSSDKPYVRFSLKEWIGYGEHLRPQQMDVWAWGYLAQQLKDMGVQQGSLVWVSGSLELEDFVRKDGRTHDKRLKLKLRDWAFVPQDKGETKQRMEEACRQSRPIQVIDGEREPLPE